MQRLMRLFALAVATAASLKSASASVFLPTPRSGLVGHGRLVFRSSTNARPRRQRSSPDTAMAIPGYGVAEQVFVGGFSNFLSLYNLLITGRILLSWFPQAQSVGALQPLYSITDPFLNLFRGVVPPLFGLDFSPILAFVLLNVVTSATAAVGCELPGDNDQLMTLRRSSRFGKGLLPHPIVRAKNNPVSLNL
jgi:uncharacterized protein YggT (Ycf19 family)